MILLDTHVLIWLAQEDHLLSRKAIAAIADARQNGSGLAIAGITLWEIAQLDSNKKVVIRASVEVLLAEVEINFTIFPITAPIARRAAAFSSRFPKDPMDRLIAATALVEGIPLLTRDQNIRASKEVPTIW